MTIASVIDVRRAADRFHTDLGWLDSKHSFSFGHHRDPGNTNHGQLIVLNDDRVAGGTGFDTHPHRDMEIVTWVLSGELEHKDSEGNRGLIRPGLAQRMSAGRGIWHSEKNRSQTDDVHFIQMWIVPDSEATDPGYQQMDVDAALNGGGLVPVASGKGHDSAISIQQKDAVLSIARLAAGDTVHLPASMSSHVFVARGDADLEGAGTLTTGDAVRLTNSDGLTLTATTATELLVWDTGLLG